MSTSLKLPRFTGWMLPDDALEIVVELIHEYKPVRILEAGSGRSTPVIAAALRDIRTGRLISLEHQREFAIRSGQMLTDNDLTGFARIHYAPLEDGWYAPNAWDDLHNIDMLIVDGPPGHSAPLAREPALKLLLERLSPSATIVLDDTHRKEEQQILRNWVALVPGLEFKTQPHSTGAISYGTLPTGAA